MNNLKSNYDKLVSLGERYFSGKDFKLYGDEGQKASYFELLNKLYKNALADTCDEVKIVIGFDKDDKPVLWYPERENLFGFCSAGRFSIYLYGLDVAFLDIALRYPKEKIRYFGFFGDGLPYRSIDDGQLIDYCADLMAEDGHARMIGVISDIKDCIEKREKLSPEELTKEPIIFINITKIQRWLYSNRFHAFIIEALPKLQRLKLAICITERNSALQDEKLSALWRECEKTQFAQMLIGDMPEGNAPLEGGENITNEYPVRERNDLLFVRNGEYEIVKYEKAVWEASIFNMLAR